jgi:hypothetical protein
LWARELKRFTSKKTHFVLVAPLAGA